MSLTAVLACTTTLLAGFVAVRPFYGVALTRWEALVSPRVGRWFDLAGALGLAFAMLGWFVPPTAGWVAAWLVALATGVVLGVVAMQTRGRRSPAE